MSRCRHRWIALAASLGTAALGACSDSSGPSDTTIRLEIDPITSPTNELAPAISGTTDPGANVTITGSADTLSQLANSLGAFSMIVKLNRDAINEFALLAVDSAGNQAFDTVEIAHDGKSPSAAFLSPGQGGATTGQSGFSIELAFADDTVGADFVSGVDAATLRIESNRRVGNVFRQDGAFSTVYDAGENLAPLFTAVGASGTSLTVPDSAAFTPGSNQLQASLFDRAGNPSATVVVLFTVGADPDRLIVVTSGGAAGSSDNPIVIGLANADSVAGVQFDLTYDTAIIASVDSVTAGDRATSFSGVDFNQIAPGRVRVLLFDTGGALIPPGQGPLITIWASVDAGATSGPHALTLETVVLSDKLGGTSALSDATGTFTVP